MASSEASPVLRLTFLSVLIIGLFIALFARLWFLQVLTGDRYVELADTNRLQTVVVEAPRGDILTEDGEALVQNRPALTVSADRQALLSNDGEPLHTEAELAIARLAELLDLDHDEVMERLTSQRYSPFRPVPIAMDVAPEVVFAIQEHQELFPGVVAETLPVRSYPHEDLGAHLVGYLNQISQAELADERYADYRGGDLIGRAGLEAYYEPYLRGTEGTRILEVNAQNRVLDVLRETEPVPGNDLIVTLDVELQGAVEYMLAEGMAQSRNFLRDDGRYLPSTAGAAVVLDVEDASVLAMASYPTFDPREFVGGLSDEYAEYLYHDEDTPQPTINRAIQGRYPPGSVYKIVTGAAFVEGGHVSPTGTRPCPPSYEQGGIVFNNWNRVDEGDMDLREAMRRSCDTYFYDLAYEQWLREDRQLDAADRDLSQAEIDEVVPDVAHRFGFGSPLGIDLPSESGGYVPTRESKHEQWIRTRERDCRLADELEEGTYGQQVSEDRCRFGGRWRGGDAINTSIGQGETQTTPLQVAMSYLAIANGGEVLRPHLGRRIVSPDGEVVEEFGREVIGTLDLDDATMSALRDGLVDVVHHERGTANEAFSGFPLDEIPIAGKTGTAEQQPRVPYAWFVAYAPADDPQYVAVVAVEEGGGGSQTAAPIVRGIFEYLFGVSSVDEWEFLLGPEILD
jgi:penicillin-binding protein 2